MRKHLLVAAAICASLVACARNANSIYVVRHMQKAEGSDPVLSAEGAANAQRLANQLGEAGITAIFATPTRRAMQTAAPLATRLRIAVTPYDPANPAALVAAAAAARGSVLVIGHSNTVPELVQRFGGARPPAMTEQDYGVVFIVEPGRTEVRQMRIDPAAPAN